ARGRGTGSSSSNSSSRTPVGTRVVNRGRVTVTGREVAGGIGKPIPQLRAVLGMRTLAVRNSNGLPTMVGTSRISTTEVVRTAGVVRDRGKRASGRLLINSSNSRWSSRAAHRLWVEMLRPNMIPHRSRARKNRPRRRLAVPPRAPMANPAAPPS
ncbi:hypothetical protein FOZ62_021213, partial [Perkinsus olseni]